MFSLLAATYLWDCYRTGFLSRSLFSRLIAIRSLDPALGLLEAGRISMGFLSHSLSTRLIAHYSFA